MKTIKIKYFGMISSNIEKVEESIELINSTTLLELKSVLFEKYPQIANIKFKMAVNLEITDDNYIISENDEIALLPPYAGG